MTEGILGVIREMPIVEPRNGRGNYVTAEIMGADTYGSLGPRELCNRRNNGVDMCWYNRDSPYDHDFSAPEIAEVRGMAAEIM